MGVLVVMCGVPGSGKSTAADMMSEAHGYAVVCPDDIREEMLGDASDQSHGAEVFAEARARTCDALSDPGIPGVVFDSTNVRRRDRVRLVRQILSAASPSRVVCVCMDTGLDECLARNAGRERVVPEDVIYRMFDARCAYEPDDDGVFDDVWHVGALDDIPDEL